LHSVVSCRATDVCWDYEGQCVLDG